MKFIQIYHKINSYIGESVYKELVDPLLCCFQDRNSSVRNKAEEIIKVIFDYIPVDINYKKIKFFKPAIDDLLNQIVNKNGGSDNNTEEKIMKIKIWQKKKLFFLKKRSLLFFLVLLINAGIVGNIHNYCNNITKFLFHKFWNILKKYIPAYNMHIQQYLHLSVEPKKYKILLF